MSLGPGHDYNESFLALKDAVGLDGEPRPNVLARPRHDDETPGPTFFRTCVEDLELHRLTLPGLYICRSELNRVNWAGSDFRLSTLNWNDFLDCDFSDCTLTKCDLRACNFVRCRFRGTDISESDLRGCVFEDCDFSSANVCRAILNKKQRSDIKLSSEQTNAVHWAWNYEEPEGG